MPCPALRSPALKALAPPLPRPTVDERAYEITHAFSSHATALVQEQEPIKHHSHEPTVCYGYAMQSTSRSDAL